MSEWQTILKSTSIEKQSNSDKILEEMGKLIADYQKEQKTNQPTTAQATQATQPLALQQQATTGYRGSPQQRKPMSGSTPKVATGFKALSQQEVESMKGFGYTDKHIKELDKQRLKQYGEAPSLGQRAGQAGQKISQTAQSWKDKLKKPPATGKPAATRTTTSPTTGKTGYKAGHTTQLTPEEQARATPVGAPPLEVGGRKGARALRDEEEVSRLSPSAQREFVTPQPRNR